MEWFDDDRHERRRGAGAGGRAGPGVADGADRRGELAAVMSRLAAGDEAAVVTLYERFGGQIAAAVQRVARHRPGRIDRGELDGLVFEVCFELASVAGGWSPDGGALPWVWARHRVANVVDRVLGHVTEVLDEGRRGRARRPPGRGGRAGGRWLDARRPRAVGPRHGRCPAARGGARPGGTQRPRSRARARVRLREADGQRLAGGDGGPRVRHARGVGAPGCPPGPRAAAPGWPPATSASPLSPTFRCSHDGPRRVAGERPAGVPRRRPGPAPVRPVVGARPGARARAVGRPGRTAGCAVAAGGGRRGHAAGHRRRRSVRPSRGASGSRWARSPPSRAGRRHRSTCPGASGRWPPRRLGVGRRRPGGRPSGVLIDADGRDQHRGPPLGGHHPVELGPVLVRPAGRGEDLAEQQAQPLGVDARQADRRGRRARPRPPPSPRPSPHATCSVARGSACSSASLRVPPRATNAATGPWLTGCGTTPALTTVACGEPPGRGDRHRRKSVVERDQAHARSSSEATSRQGRRGRAPTCPPSASAHSWWGVRSRAPVNGSATGSPARADA